MDGGPGTRDHWLNGPRDQGPLQWGPGQLTKSLSGPGTKASRFWDQIFLVLGTALLNLDGNRDQMAKTGWD